MSSVNDDTNGAAPLDQQEELDDLQLPADWYFGATLWSTDWTVETIISQLRRQNINLSPKFQRRNAWRQIRQSRFIESLILGLPVPQIILAEDRSRRGSFIVIDGKQRLLSLRQFAADESDPEYTPLKLSGLNDRTDLNGLTYNDLKADPKFRDDCNSFENQTVRTIVIRNWKDDRYLHSVFLRINTGSVQLSTQELRQALHPGPFSDFIDDLSVKTKELQEVLKLKEPDFRMRDVELVLRYYAYLYFADKYKGNLKEFLDDTVQAFNGEWNNKEKSLVDAGDVFRESLLAVRKVFGEKAQLRKYNPREKAYERRINRAVFDIMMYYIKDGAVRDAFLKRGKAVKAAFEKLCENDREFASALEATTKSVEANKARFSIWADALSVALKTKITSPMK